MRKMDEIETEDSCLNRSGSEEPLFVLCGRDPAAGDAIREWIRQRVRMGLNKGSDPKIIGAADIIREMEEWYER